MLLYSLLGAIGYLIWIIRMVIICQFVLYLLIAFNVVEMRNRFIQGLWDALNAIVEPMVAPIRRVMPPVGGMDFSYMVLIFGLSLVSRVIGFAAVSALA
ncbi:MAG: YggT family protein [Novosphingobium sp.]|uniref:YggT family protein n=1 Tax=Novosphingobium sp. TaxID=1874826 RepID=UPI0018304F00|nr:YggT family protein [Novosphingobium sp.]